MGINYLNRIDQSGFEIGYKMLEYLYPKVKPGKRPTKLLEVLQFISSSFWKLLFGRNVDSLERGTENDNEYMITDFHPLCSKYISVPNVQLCILYHYRNWGSLVVVHLLEA